MSKESLDTEELKELARDFEHSIERERERMMEEIERQECFLKLVQSVGELGSLNEDLMAAIESLDDEQLEGKKIGQLVMEQNNYGVPVGISAGDGEKRLEALND